VIRKEGATRVKRATILLTALWISILLPASSLPACSAEQPIRIACVGDSITYGAGLPERERNCYPALLGAFLGDRYEVRNFGRNGATLLKKGDLPIWKCRELEAACDFEPHLVLIKLGTNDTKSNNWRHHAEFEADLRGLINRFRSLPSSPRVILCLPAPAFQSGDGIDGSRVKNEVIPRIRRVAARTACELVDLHTPQIDRTGWFPDTVHPNPFGMETMARTIFEYLSIEREKDFRIERKLGLPTKQGEFHGFERLDFSFQEQSCIVVKPKLTATGRPWIWRARFFGHEPQADLALLERGFHLVYCDVAGLYGAPRAVALWDGFYDLMRRAGLAEKATLEGFSRGGLIVYSWAAAHPERVVSIYGDAPVTDFHSWPGGRGKGKGSPADWQRLLAAHEIAEEEAERFDGKPNDLAAKLAPFEVPILHVVGQEDSVVPVAENTDILEERYRALGGPIAVIRKPGVDHHPHSLENPRPIVDFILEHAGQRLVFAALPAPSAEFRGHAAGWGGGTWWDQFDAIARLGRENADRIRLVFLGDSISQSWTGTKNRLADAKGERLFDRCFGRYGAASFGISGDRTEHLLYRIREGNFDAIEPEVIVVMIGVNNINAAGHSGEDVAAGIRAVVKALRVKEPQADIVLLCCFPTGFEPDSAPRQAVDTIHRLCGPLHDGKKVHYLDLRSLFLAEDGTIDHRFIRNDNIHLTPEGYTRWAEAMKPTIEKLLPR